MTPEQIERTFEFILQHQARTALHLDRLSTGQIEMQPLLVKMTELAEIQSQRIDRNDAALQEFRVWQKEALARLDTILHRLDR